MQEQKYRCPQCPQEFTDENQLQQHTRQQHQQQGGQQGSEAQPQR
jgi:hypothetical protein